MKTTVSQMSKEKYNIEKRRVVLLLDLDCFYAQCETVRLGLDPDIPLALIQVTNLMTKKFDAAS